MAKSKSSPGHLRKQRARSAERKMAADIDRLIDNPPVANAIAHAFQAAKRRGH